MNFLGFLRVKDEARWIERVIRSIQPLCERIFVMDDHSQDGTGDICRNLGCTVFASPYTGVNESRDKNWLLERVWMEARPQTAGAESQTFIVAIDGDEELEPLGPQKIRRDCIRPGVHALALQIVYLWDNPQQIRTDGIYGKFTRGSVFRMISPFHTFGRPMHRNRDAANFHCGSIPYELMSKSVNSDAKLLHYGYMEKSDRLRKFDWYRGLDKNNSAEDGYRHMVQGDIPEVPASWRQGIELMHAGPLVLEPLAR